MLKMNEWKNGDFIATHVYNGEVCFETGSAYYFNNRDEKTIERYDKKTHQRIIVANFCIKNVKKTTEGAYILEIENIKDGILTIEAKATNLIEKIKETGYIIDSRFLEAVVFGYINNKQRGDSIEIIVNEKPGVYLDGNKIKYDVKGSWMEGAKLFNNLLSFYNNKGRAAFIMVYTAVLSLHYWLKQRKIYLKYLYLYGPSRSGKSTLIRLAQMFWPFIVKKSGAQISSPYTFSKAIDEGYFCVVADEPKSLFEDNEIVEMIKIAQQEFEIRSRKYENQIKTYMARSGIVLISNFGLPKDSALKNRFIEIRTDVADKEEIAKKERDFELFYRSLESKKEDIGAFFKRILEKTLELGIDEYNYLEVINKAISEIYKEAGLEKDFEISHKTKEEEDLGSDIVKGIIKGLIEEYIRIYGRIIGKESPTTLINKLAESGLSTTIMKKNNLIYLTKNILHYIRIKEELELEDLGYILEGKVEYKSFRIGEKVFHRKALIIEEKKFNGIIAAVAETEEEIIKDISNPDEEYIEYLEERYT